MRTIEWPRTAAGKTRTLACPLGTQGDARWHCGDDGTWLEPHPDLSGCQSLWLTKIHEQLRQRGVSVVHLAKEAAHYANFNALYGGDLPALLSAMGAMAEKMGFGLGQVPTARQREAVIVELVQVNMKTHFVLL